MTASPALPLAAVIGVQAAAPVEYAHAPAERAVMVAQADAPAANPLEQEVSVTNQPSASGVVALQDHPSDSPAARDRRGNDLLAADAGHQSPADDLFPLACGRHQSPPSQAWQGDQSLEYRFWALWQRHRW